MIKVTHGSADPKVMKLAENVALHLAEYGIGFDVDHVNVSVHTHDMIVSSYLSWLASIYTREYPDIVTEVKSPLTWWDHLKWETPFLMKLVAKGWLKNVEFKTKRLVVNVRGHYPSIPIDIGGKKHSPLLVYTWVDPESGKFFENGKETDV
jgi:hypothetical protein